MILSNRLSGLFVSFDGRYKKNYLKNLITEIPEMKAFIRSWNSLLKFDFFLLPNFQTINYKRFFPLEVVEIETPENESSLRETTATLKGEKRVPIRSAARNFRPIKTIFCLSWIKVLCLIEMSYQRTNVISKMTKINFFKYIFQIEFFLFFLFKSVTRKSLWKSRRRL